VNHSKHNQHSSAHPMPYWH